MFRVLVMSSFATMGLASSSARPGWGLTSGGGSKYPASPSPNPAHVRAVGPPDCSNQHLAGCVTVPIMNHRRTTAASSFEAPDCTAPGRVGCMTTYLGAAPPPGMPVHAATALNYRAVVTTIGGNIQSSLDVDGDGDLDILTNTQLMINNGWGAFTASSTYTGGGTFAADLDGDGDIDILEGCGSLQINDGSATFTAQQVALPTSTGSASCWVADVDGDGDMDIVGPQFVMLNDGSLGFTADTRTSAFTTGLDAELLTASLFIADLDGDGDLDILEGNVRRGGDSGWGTRRGNNRLLWNDGSGIFTEDTNNPFSAPDGDTTLCDGDTIYDEHCQATEHVIAADIDNDGDLDIIETGGQTTIAGGLVGTARVLINDGTGTFTLDADHSFLTSTGLSNPEASALRVADIDNDGDADIIMPLSPNDNGGSPNNKVLLGNGQGGFEEVTSSPFTSTQSTSVLVADVDNDGDMDIVDTYGTTFRVLFNNGPGSFIGEPTSAVAQLYSMVLEPADLDGDGDLDLVEYPYDTTGLLAPQVLWNDGFGIFTPDTSTAVSDGGPRSFVTADFDGDGDIDLYQMSMAPTASRLLLNNGLGTFTQAPNQAAFDGAGQIGRAIAADVDGDGDLDILEYYSPAAPRTNRLLLNDGSGGFTEDAGSTFAASPPGGPQGTYLLHVADVDGDGDLDIIEISAEPAQPNRLLLNDGSGGFTDDSRTWWVGGASFGSVSCVADLDGDGDIDIASASGVFINDGTGIFTQENSRWLATPDEMMGIACVDIDGDADIDVLAGSYSAQNIAMVNNGLGFFTNDANHIFVTGGADTSGVVAADFDNDGDLDIIEMSIMTQTNRFLRFVHCSSGVHSTPSGLGCLSACPAYAGRHDLTDVCVGCPRHMDPDSTGECVACTLGQQRQAGMDACTPCPIGTSQLTAGTDCVPCAIGTYAALTGSLVCSPCPSFSSSSTTGATSVEECTCVEGYYRETDDAGTTTCLACPDGSSTSGLGGTGLASCDSCRTGFIYADGRCQTCEDLLGDAASFVDCSVRGMSLAVLPVIEGYWRVNNASLPGECLTEGACAGVEMNATTTSSAATTTAGRRRRLTSAITITDTLTSADTYGDGLCRPGHSGPFCEICITDWYKGVDGLCSDCSASDGSVGATVAIPVLIVVLVIVLVIGAVCRGRKEAIEQLVSGTNISDVAMQASTSAAASGMGKTKLAGLLASGVMVRLKIFLSKLQVLAQLNTVFSITYPPVFTSAVRWVGLVQLDLFTLVPLGCIYASDFHTFLLVRTLVPIGVLLLLASGAYCLLKTNDTSTQKGASRVWLANVLMSVFLLLVFLIYPSTSNLIFSAFPCTNLDDGSRVLRADMSIDCDSSTHTAYQNYAIFMLFVIPFGVPALYAYLLFSLHGGQLRNLARVEVFRKDHAKNAASEDKYNSSSSQSTPLLLQAQPRLDALKVEEIKLRSQLPRYIQTLTGSGYALRTFYFEIFECLRKLMVMCLPIFFPAGSGGQLIFGLMVCFITGMMYSYIMPYSEYRDNQMALLAQATIFFTLLSSIELPSGPEVSSRQAIQSTFDVLLSFLFLLPIVLEVCFFTGLCSVCEAKSDLVIKLFSPRSDRAKTSSSTSSSTETSAKV